MTARRRGSKPVASEPKKTVRKTYTTEDKIRIVLEGLKGEKSVSQICREEGINPHLYYNWTKKFIAAGKNSLNGKIETNISSEEFMNLKIENMDLKELVAELSLKVRHLRSKLSGPE